jgi:hypothetical protein
MTRIYLQNMLETPAAGIAAAQLGRLRPGHLLSWQNPVGLPAASPAKRTPRFMEILPDPRQPENERSRLTWPGTATLDWRDLDLR